MSGHGNHGMHVAGTVAASSNNGIGVAGVAGGNGNSPGASILTVTFFGTASNGGMGSVSPHNGIRYAVDQGARIIQNSWGYTAEFPNFSGVVRDAIDYAVNQGAIVTFAAGNDNSDGYWWPARYDKVMAVAAIQTGNSGTGRARASFSNYGDWVDISAPGVSVYSLSQTGYTYLSGTSMACPHVSGLLALGFSVWPDLTKAQAENCLYTTAVNIDSANPNYIDELGAGFIDANAFLECVKALAPTQQPTASPVQDPTAAHS